MHPVYTRVAALGPFCVCCHIIHPASPSADRSTEALLLILMARVLFGKPLCVPLSAMWNFWLLSHTSSEVSVRDCWEGGCYLQPSPHLCRTATFQSVVQDLSKMLPPPQALSGEQDPDPLYSWKFPSLSRFFSAIVRPIQAHSGAGGRGQTHPWDRLAAKLLSFGETPLHRGYHLLP